MQLVRMRGLKPYDDVIRRYAALMLLVLVWGLKLVILALHPRRICDATRTHSGIETKSQGAYSA